MNTLQNTQENSFFFINNRRNTTFKWTNIEYCIIKTQFSLGWMIYNFKVKHMRIKDIGTNHIINSSFHDIYLLYYVQFCCDEIINNIYFSTVWKFVYIRICYTKSKSWAVSDKKRQNCDKIKILDILLILFFFFSYKTFLYIKYFTRYFNVLS